MLTRLVLRCQNCHYSVIKKKGVFGDKCITASINISKSFQQNFTLNRLEIFNRRVILFPLGQINLL